MVVVIRVFLRGLVGLKYICADGDVRVISVGSDDISKPFCTTSPCCSSTVIIFIGEKNDEFFTLSIFVTFDRIDPKLIYTRLIN